MTEAELSAPVGALRVAPAPAGRRVTRDSAWLVLGYGATTGIGFLFWMVAGATLSPHDLGVDASIVSAFSAAATFASIGTGSALIVMLPRSGAGARQLVTRAVAATAVLAAVSGAVAGVLVALVLPVALPPAVTIAGVAVCTVVWALFNLQSQALVGVGDARSTLFVNGSGNLLKLALLVAAAAAPRAVGHPVVVATIVPAALAAAVSLGPVVARGTRAEALRHPEVAWSADRSRAFHSFAAQNTVAVGIVLAMGSALAFVVTALSTPAEGAVFAIAFTFSAALDLVGVAVATALARASADEPSAGGRLVRSSAVKVAAIALALAIVMTAATPILFGLFGPGYDPGYATAVVAVLLAASVIRPGFDMWSARVRAERRVLPVLWANLAYVVILLGLLLALVPRWGALGASAAVAASALWLAAVGGVGIRRLRRPVPAPHPLRKGDPA